MVKQLILSAVLAIPVTGAVVGCEEEVASEKTVDVKEDGTVVTEEETVTKDDEGNVTKTEEKSVDTPAE